VSHFGFLFVDGFHCNILLVVTFQWLVSQLKFLFSIIYFLSFCESCVWVHHLQLRPLTWWLKRLWEGKRVNKNACFCWRLTLWVNDCDILPEDFCNSFSTLVCHNKGKRPGKATFLVQKSISCLPAWSRRIYNVTVWVMIKTSLLVPPTPLLSEVWVNTSQPPLLQNPCPLHAVVHLQLLTKKSKMLIKRYPTKTRTCWLVIYTCFAGILNESSKSKLFRLDLIVSWSNQQLW